MLKRKMMPCPRFGVDIGKVTQHHPLIRLQCQLSGSSRLACIPREMQNVALMFLIGAPFIVVNASIAWKMEVS